MTRHRSDSTARQIVDNIRKEPGYSVVYTNGAPGTPDAFIGHRVNATRRWHGAEFKSLGGRLRESQLDFIAKAQGCVHVATSSYEMLLLIRACEALN